MAYDEWTTIDIVPDDDRAVLIYGKGDYDDKSFVMGYYEDDKWYNDNGDEMNTGLTHWRDVKPPE